MRFFLAIFLAFAFGLAQDIKWSKNYETALSEALKTDKAVILIYTMEDCSACEYLKDITLDDENVKSYINKNFILVERDAKNKSQHIKGFPFFGSPTLYFLNKNGEQISKVMVGATTAKVFLEKLKQIK